MSEGVAEQVAGGAGWTISTRLVDAAVAMVSTFILARLLTPSDFGLVALAVSLAAVLELIKSFGFDMVLIHKQDADRTHYDTAWSFTVLFSAVIAGLLVVGAVPLARFYEDDRLTGIVYLIAFAKLVDGFQNVGVVDFRKLFQFSREFAFVVIRRILTFAVTLILALTFRDYWALVVGMVFSSLFGLVLSFVLHPYRPRFSMHASRELFNFSKWIAANAMANVMAVRFGDFLIGKVSGAASLGLFTVANELGFTTATQLGAPINRAVYPGYARVSGDLMRLRHGYYRVVGVISLIAVPSAVGLASVSDSLVPVLLGAKWLAAIPLVSILAFRGLINAVVSNVQYVYLAIGKPRLSTLVLVMRVIVLIPSLWFSLVQWGLLGAAWAYVASLALEIPVHLMLLRHQIGARARQLLAVVWRPIVSAGVMALAVRALSDQWLASTAFVESALKLITLVSAGVAIYVAVILVLWQLRGRPRGAEQDVLEAVRSRLPVRLA